MNFNLIFTIALTLAYMVWPVCFILSIMALGGPYAINSKSMGTVLLILYYPLYLALISAIFQWRYFNLPLLAHVGIVAVVVTAVLYWSGHLSKFSELRRLQPLEGEVILYHGVPEGVGGGPSAEIKLPNGHVETIKFSHTFPYDFLMQPGFKIPLHFDPKMSEYKVRFVQELRDKNNKLANEQEAR